MKQNFKVVYEEVLVHEFEVGPCEPDEISEEFEREKDNSSFDFSDGALVSSQVICAYDEAGNKYPLNLSHADLEAEHEAHAVTKAVEEYNQCEEHLQDVIAKSITFDTLCNQKGMSLENAVANVDSLYPGITGSVSSYEAYFVECAVKAGLLEDAIAFIEDQLYIVNFYSDRPSSDHDLRKLLVRLKKLNCRKRRTERRVAK